MLRYFGPPQALPHFESIDVPLGLHCLHCGEPFKPGDRGFVMPWETRDQSTASCAYHLDCFVSIVGFGPRDWITGRVETVAAALGIEPPRLTEALKAAPSLQEGLAPYRRTLELLNAFHGGDPRSVRQWLTTPHRELADHAPLDLMLEGRAEVVRDMLEAAWMGLPT